MNFSLTNEQRLLAKSAKRFIREQHAFNVAAIAERQSAAGQTALWGQFAEMGWLGMPFAEEDCGLGCGAIETMLLMEAFGGGLVNSPYISTVVFGGTILQLDTNSDARRSRLGALIKGHTTIAIAHSEPQARYQLQNICTSASRSAHGWLLSGKKSTVLHVAHATHLIVAARTSGAPLDYDGITLFWLPIETLGITRRIYPLLDGITGADIEFNNVILEPSAVIGTIGDGFRLLQAGVNASLAAYGADALGTMDALLAETIAYSQMRQQFGQPIGKFQVLQHRMVDMFMEIEQSRSLVLLATIRLDESGGGSNSTVVNSALSAMKAQLGRAGRFIGQEAVQLHGGMGMSNDVIVGHFFRRLTAFDALLGNVDHHLTEFANMRYG
jgi:alkylation response protein AidB-like acyl-CoA dehydrogenase